MCCGINHPRALKSLLFTYSPTSSGQAKYYQSGFSPGSRHLQRKEREAVIKYNEFKLKPYGRYLLSSSATVRGRRPSLLRRSKTQRRKTTLSAVMECIYVYQHRQTDVNTNVTMVLLANIAARYTGQSVPGQYPPTSYLLVFHYGTGSKQCIAYRLTDLAQRGHHRSVTATIRSWSGCQTINTFRYSASPCVV